MWAGCKFLYLFSKLGGNSSHKAPDTTCLGLVSLDHCLPISLGSFHCLFLRLSVDEL